MQSQAQPPPFKTDRQALLRTLFLASSLLTLLLLILYSRTPFGEFLDLRAIDWLINSKTTTPTEQRTITVEIDDTSLEQQGQWPWPRYRLAMLFKKIQESGAKTIAVNILFPEPDRTSPNRWKETLFNELGYTIDTSAIPEMLLDHDAYLSSTLADGNYVLGYEFLFQAPVNNQYQCDPVPIILNPKKTIQGDHTLALHKAAGILCNNKTLSQPGGQSGFFNGAPDKDGTLRRLPLLINFKGNIYPSFALKTLFNNNNIENITITKGLLGIRNIFPGKIPIDRKGNYVIGNYASSHGLHISAHQVMSNQFDPAVFNDKVVFIGITASGLAREYHLPNGTNISMVNIHKLLYESLFTHQHNARGDFFWVIEVLLSICISFLCAFLIARLPTAWAFSILLLILGLLGIGCLALSWKWGLLFSPLLPGICLILTFFLLTTLKYRFFQIHSASEAGDALQLLETSQANLQSILNTIPDIVFRLDKNGKIIFISSAVTKYQNQQTPLLGKSIFDLVVPEDRDKAQYKLNERRTGSRATHDLEVRLQFSIDSPDKRNEIRYFSVSAAGLYKSNNTESPQFIGTQGIVKDITQRKQIENQLLQAKKMEAMGNLAAGIAHDLNNILSGLVSYPDMILADLSEDDPLYKKISLIKKSGKKAAVIVQDLLTLSRRNILHQVVFDLNSIILDYLESTEHTETSQNHPLITITTKITDFPINLIGSPVHISKVVMNLLNNAMEATTGRGEIIISTSKIKTKQVLTGYEDIPPGNYGCITIKDSGTGIPAADVPRIFEPFYTKKPTPSKSSGTGLGMTIIWATIKDHNGYIDISSTQEHGTTFTIYLPATDQQIPIPSKHHSIEHYKGRETILVVDDLDEQLTIAGNMLRQLGYKAITATGGAEALDILSRSTVDLVILDMIMPGQMDGLETYEKIIQQNPKQKAIVSSGYSESDRVRKMQELGAGSYIQKPYSMEELASAIRTELDSSA